jgi:hypothetical protein
LLEHASHGTCRSCATHQPWAGRVRLQQL